MDAYIHEAALAGDTFLILFSGCNFQCRFCNTPHLVEFRTEERMVLRDVKALLSSSGATKALFSGGEPLLQRQALLDLATHAKQKGLTIILETNASKPETLKTLLDAGLLDEVVVDVKGAWPAFEKASRSGTFFQPAAEIYEDTQKCLALLRQHDGVTITFKTVITPGILYKKEDLLGIAQLLRGFDAEWLLVPFDPTNTLDPTLKAVAPSTERFLENLAGFVKQQYPKLRVKVAESAVPSQEPS
jgi:pyruvate formate lyase activating enzyme